MMIWLLTLTLLLVLPISAQDLSKGKRLNDWVNIAESQKPVATLHYSQKSIRRDADLITLWGKWEFPEGWEANGLRVGSVRGHFTLNCGQRKVVGRGVVVYDISNRIIHEDRKRENVKETPNTLGWALFEYFCERPRPAATTPPQLKIKP